MQGGGTIQAAEADVDERETFGFLFSFAQSVVQFLFRFYCKSTSGTQNIGQQMIIPGDQIIVRTVLNVAFGAVAGIIKQHDNGVQMITNGCAQFHAGHLKGAVADQNQRTTVGMG